MLKFGIEAVSEKLSNNKMIFFRFLVKLNRVICTEIVQVYTQAHTQIYKHTHASTHAHIHVRAHTHIYFLNLLDLTFWVTYVLMVIVAAI